MSLLTQIVISVSDPEVKKEYGGAKQYYLYTIKGQDSKGRTTFIKVQSIFNAATLTLTLLEIC